jgi:hypothetical protein
VSLASVYPSQCPFQIRFNYIGYQINDKKPLTFYHVKITYVNVEHTCKLSTLSHRTALQKGGHLKLDLSKLQTLLLLLREKPRLVDTRTLRPCLEKHLPHYKGVSAKFVCNFRRRVFAYWARTAKDEELTMEEAQNLASANTTAADDLIDMDDPIIRLNVGNMLRKIMQDSTSWKANRFLETLQKTIRGFVFSVRFDSQGLPDAFLYMTPWMQKDLNCFGDIIFLDAQCRQFNSSGFPYISPILHDLEGKIAQEVESIVIEESHETYTWALTEMERLEPRFRFDQISLIFADMGITKTLLHQLSIENTCVLRGDYWHLMNEVWNKPTSFGGQFDCTCLRRMMYLIQCEHEYNATKNVDKGKYHD